MKEKFNRLYEDMMSDAKRLLRKELPELERVECCYRITESYWAQVKELCKEMKFADQNEEIEFFKDIKPKFTSQIEYFLILYEALLMVSKNFSEFSTQEALLFWENETKRYKRFYEKNEEFIMYYENDERNLDSQYFVRTNKNPGITANVRVYDMNSNLYSLHGQLLTTWLANKMYYEYVLKKLETLAN